MRIVFHIDMDAFFAAVEERENPSLKGKPVVIGADPKGGRGRGVVSTSNYIAREYGVHSGMPISIAYRKCPGAIFLPVNFSLYWRASEKIMAILRDHAQKLQQVSVDEAFLEAKNTSTYLKAESVAKKIKKEIMQKEKLTCSIGIGPNKLVAKLASDYKKPGGLTIVKPSAVNSFMFPMFVRKLYGVGPKTEHVLKSMGINTIGDLAKYNQKKLAQLFGKWGAYLHEYASGIDSSPIIEHEESKSIGREVTFEKDTKDFALLKQTIDEISDDIYKAAKQSGYEFRTVVLKIRFEDFETHTRQKSLKDEPPLGFVKEIANQLLQHFIKRGKKVRLIGLRLTGLKKSREKQTTLRPQVSK